LIQKNIEGISLDDIYILLENKVPEGRTLEYKSELPHEGDSQKIPFLAEVSAFANSVGGDMIFGVTEENGFIKSVEGIKEDDQDKEIQRLENAIQNGIEPRLVPPPLIKTVALENRAFLMILRVPQSWNAPHRVVYKDHAKFYGRGSSGKFPLDVAQLRAAFLGSEHLSEKIHNFRKDRVISLLTDRLQTYNLSKGGRLVLHLLPLSAFAGTRSNQIQPKIELSKEFPPLPSSLGGGCKLNIDGLITYALDRDQKVLSYCQIFRSGIIESVAVFPPRQNGELVFPGPWYVENILKISEKYLTGLFKFSIQIPIYLAISFVDIKGYRLGLGDMFFHSEGELFDRGKFQESCRF